LSDFSVFLKLDNIYFFSNEHNEKEKYEHYLLRHQLKQAQQ